MSTHPDEVPELEGWRFIRDHPIAKAVERYEPGRLRLARYHSDDGEYPRGQLAVMRLFFGELPGIKSNEKWRSWVIVVRGIDDYEQALVGEPDRRIVELLGRFDTWARGRDPRHLQKFAARIREQREKRAQERFAEHTDDLAYAAVREHQRSQSSNPRIFIPDTGSKN